MIGETEMSMARRWRQEIDSRYPAMTQDQLVCDGYRSDRAYPFIEHGVFASNAVLTALAEASFLSHLHNGLLWADMVLLVIEIQCLTPLRNERFVAIPLSAQIFP
jgi:hypothetical protein